MPETQREHIKKMVPTMPEPVIDGIVEAEKLILQRASKQDREFPYDLTLTRAGIKIASEKVIDSRTRDAIIRGEQVDAEALMWTFTATAESEFSNLKINLHSGIRDLTQDVERR